MSNREDLIGSVVLLICESPLGTYQGLVTSIDEEEEGESITIKDFLYYGRPADAYDITICFKNILEVKIIRTKDEALAMAKEQEEMEEEIESAVLQNLEDLHIGTEKTSTVTNKAILPKSEDHGIVNVNTAKETNQAALARSYDDGNSHRGEEVEEYWEDYLLHEAHYASAPPLDHHVTVNQPGSGGASSKENNEREKEMSYWFEVGRRWALERRGRRDTWEDEWQE